MTVVYFIGLALCAAALSRADELTAVEIKGIGKNDRPRGYRFTSGSVVYSIQRIVDESLAGKKISAYE